MKICFEITRSKSKNEWRVLNSISELPRDETFLLLDEEASSGLSIYEAMVDEDGIMCCPATYEQYELKDFSYWRPMLDFPVKEKRFK